MAEFSIKELSQFWGKARPNVASDSAMHPLIAHMLDVAAVAMALPLAKSCGLDIRLVGFLVALHDIGKLSPPFQKKVPEYSPSFLPPKSTVSEDHTVVTLQILSEWFENGEGILKPLFQNIIQGKGLKKYKYLKALQDILRGVAGHHGKPIEARYSGSLDIETMQRAEKIAALLLDVFQPPPFPISILESITEVEWKLTALTIQADWVGSRQEWFPYVAVGTVYNPREYFENIAVPQAKKAVKEAGLAAIPVAEFRGIKNLFPVIEKPSPLQSLMENAPFPDSPALIIIEDMTGSGKTEAALTAAHRLMRKTSDNHGTAGLFVGLPTMATANAMYERLAEAYQRLFVRAEISPSLALAHGRADLYENFCAAIMPEEANKSFNPDSAEFYCTAWLGNESRRALMAQVGVGTIDQALLSVLPVRHTAIRQAGLAHKVILIDECHAFDSYMNEEIYALLRFHAALGGSAILLSATLTRAMREKLVEAFQEGLGETQSCYLENMSYPLVTIAGLSFRRELPCDLREGLARTIKVTRLNSPEEVESVLLDGFHKGAACCWIRNTVDDVITTARALSAQGVDVTVFHARFAMIDRLEIEKKVIACFGKKSKDSERAGLLIASQVIEQSLDLDFDVLCTDLAPMDLILQRAGRLRRHKRERRPVDKAELCVLSPEPVEKPDRLWIRSFLPGTAAIYGDPTLLWCTAKGLFRRGTISLPEDMRDLIEEVDHRQDFGADLSALENEANNKEGDNKAAARQGRHNVLRFNAGYDLDKALWGPEEKTPTRLETSRYVTVRLAYEKEGLVLPWAARKDKTLASFSNRRKAWSLSEISVRRNRLANVVTPLHLVEAVQKARSEWSKWERDDTENYLLLVIRPCENGWEAEGIDGKECKITIYYSGKYGLDINKQ